ncbi:hypothetical protein JCM8097_004301 [Rhodosporidiobolus ruineniae]
MDSDDAHSAPSTLTTIVPAVPAPGYELILVSPSANKLVLYSPRTRQFAVQPAFALPSVSSSTSTATAGDDEAPTAPPLPAPSTASSSSSTPRGPASYCPFCHQPVLRPPGRHPSPLQHQFLPLPPSDPLRSAEPDSASDDADWGFTSGRRRRWTRSGTTAHEGAYFELLSEANSLAGSPRTTGTQRGIEGVEGAGVRDEGLHEGQMNEGYCARFFEEVQLLGRGGQGSVYLVRHVLNGEGLGLYALKKIRVGDSTLSLLQILREVHLLESVSHPNIINYAHAWLETSSPTAFSPPVPTLHVLMAFANGGSLQSFIHQRGGGAPLEEEMSTRMRRKERLRAKSRGGGSGGSERAIHLLRVEDLLDLFRDVVSGLAFLHSRNVLHLDLKAENVLLHWDEDSLLPTCKLSDFGNATSDSYHRERHGGSGTLEYAPPESWLVDPKTGKLSSPDRATDQWALGLVLHLLCFFALPWTEGEDTERLETEIRGYRGFFPSDVFPSSPSSTPHHFLTLRHDLPPSVLLLLSSLINLTPHSRPSCDRVLHALPGIRRDAAELAANGGFNAEGAGGEVALRQPVRYAPVVRRAVPAPARGVLPALGDGEGEREGKEGRPQRRGSVSLAARGRHARALPSPEPDEDEREEDEERWELLPARRSSIPRRLSSPSLALSHRSSASSPVSPPPRSPTYSRQLTPPSPSVLVKQPYQSNRRAVLAALARNRVVRNKVLAAAVGVGKLLLLPPSLRSALPLPLALLLLLETAIDVALADRWVTVGLLVVHLAVVQVVGRVW